MLYHTYTSDISIKLTKIKGYHVQLLTIKFPSQLFGKKSVTTDLRRKQLFFVMKFILNISKA